MAAVLKRFLLLAPLALLAACASDKGTGTTGPSSSSPSSAPPVMAKPKAAATPEEMLPRVVPKTGGGDTPAVVEPEANTPVDTEIPEAPEKKTEEQEIKPSEKPLDKPTDKPTDKPAEKPEDEKAPEEKKEEEPSSALDREPPPAPIPHSGEPKDLPEVEKKKFLAAQVAAQNVKLGCGKEGCHPSVGLLSFVDDPEVMDPVTRQVKKMGWGASQCTASLVAPDILVTNGHCVPKDLRKEESPCAGRMWITFGADPRHPGYDRQLGCAKVIYAEKSAEIDYAYLQLERASNRPQLRLSREGIEHEKIYHLHKVNPVLVRGGLGGVYEKAACRALQDTAVFDYRLSSQTHIQLLTDCAVIPGNSGGSVVGADGTVRGVAMSFLKKKDLHADMVKNGSRGPKSPDDLAHLNLMTNFPCLKEPGKLADSDLPEACDGYNDRLQAALRAAAAAKAVKLNPISTALIRQHGGARADLAAFRWTLFFMSLPGTGPVAFGTPECVASPAASLFGKKTPLYRPRFYVTAEYDRYARASNYGLVWGGFEKSASALQIARAGAGYQVEITNPRNGQFHFSGALGACR